MSRHMEDLLARRPELAPCRNDIETAFAVLRDCYAGEGTVLLCGNGGSAADAEHLSGELLKGFEGRRPLPDTARATLPNHLQDVLQASLPTIPLSGFLSLSTAFANDVDGQYVFAQLVWGLGRAGDTLLGFSTSGNSKNVCLAMETAAAKGLRRVALTGADGGRLNELVDVCIRVPETKTYRVQELHLPVYHCLALMLEEHFFGTK